MKDPSSLLTKFGLSLEEYDFSVHYVKGSQNVTADALSSELKDMSVRANESVNVTTHAQRKKADLRVQNAASTSGDRLDQPMVVEVLKRPVGTVELYPLQESEFIQEIINNAEGIYQHTNN